MKQLIVRNECVMYNLSMPFDRDGRRHRGDHKLHALSGRLPVARRSRLISD